MNIHYLIKFCSILAVLTLFCTQAGAATLVVDDTGGGDYATIQEAVDNANAGDKILIRPHSDPRGWHESVVVNTSDITLVGGQKKGRKTAKAAFANHAKQRCSNVYLDGCDDTDCEKNVLTVNASGVSLERVFIRHGYVEFTASADNGSVLKSCVLGDVNDPIRTSDPGPNGITIRGNVFQGGRSESVDLYGDNHVIKSNWLLPCDDGLRISGDNGQITQNTLRHCNDDMIEYNGDNGTITKNQFLGGDGSAIDYNGDNPTITDNFITGIADDGINVDCLESNPACTGGTISKNEIEASTDDDEGIQIANANNFLIENNNIFYSTEHGISFNGQNSAILGNTIVRAGTESTGESAIRIGSEGTYSGGNNLIENNTLFYSTFNSIRQEGGDNNTFRGNTITGSGRAGIRVDSGDSTVVSDNKIIDGQGEGIAVTGGTNTQIIDNTVTGNRTDICDDSGSIATFTGNTFDTGGTTTPCIVN